MVSETPNPQLALIPERHPQHDLFICDVADAVLKDVMPQTWVRGHEAHVSKHRLFIDEVGR